MRGLLKLSAVEMKLFLREPMSAFFVLVFPLMMLFLFGSIYGNQPTPFFGGYGSVDISVPAYAAMIIATSGLLSLTIILASYREFGVLRRLKATPVRPLTILAAQVVVIFAMTVLGMLLLVVAARLVYHLRFDGNPLLVSVAFVFCSLSFFSLGFVLASVLPSARSAQAVAMVLFFPMLFLSGATIPAEILPASVRSWAQLLPLTHVVTLLRGLWVGQPFSAHLREIVVLFGMTLGATLLAVRTFRWE